MFTVLTILHVFICLFLILVVLLQAGKGGGMGIGFGGATSQSVFGGSGAGNFLSRTTAVVATMFILNSLALAYLSTQRDSPRLRALAEEKQKAKESEESAKSKILKDLQKARTGAQTGAAAAEQTPPAESVQMDLAPAATAPNAGDVPVATPPVATPPAATPPAATPPAEAPVKPAAAKPAQKKVAPAQAPPAAAPVEAPAAPAAPPTP